MPILLIFDACSCRWELWWSLYASERRVHHVDSLGGSLGDAWSLQIGPHKRIASARSGCTRSTSISYQERQCGLWGAQQSACCAVGVIWTLRVQRTLCFGRHKRISRAHSALADCGGRARLSPRIEVPLPAVSSAVCALRCGSRMGSLDRLNA